MGAYNDKFDETVASQHLSTDRPPIGVSAGSVKIALKQEEIKPKAQH
jgi:hypothetical protein